MIMMMFVVVVMVVVEGKKYFVTYPPDDYVPIPDFDVAKWGGFYAMHSLFKPEFGIDTSVVEHDPPMRDPTVHDIEKEQPHEIMGLFERPQERYETHYFQYPPKSRTVLGLSSQRPRKASYSLSQMNRKSREVDPKDDPRHYLESNEYFAEEYVGLVVETEDNQVWTKTIVHPGKKLHLRGVSRLDKIQMKNQSLIDFKIWVSPVDPEKDSSQLVWRNRTCRTNDFDHYTRFGDIHEKVMLWYLVSNVGSIQIFVDPRFVPSEKCTPMTGNYDPDKLYRNFTNPRENYDWRNDVWEYPTNDYERVLDDNVTIRQGFEGVQEEATTEESCDIKLSRCVSNMKALQKSSRRVVKCEAHLALREAQDVQITKDALDRIETCETILSDCHQNVVEYEKLVHDTSNRENMCRKEIVERDEMLNKIQDELIDSQSRVSDCSLKLSNCTLSASVCADEVKTCVDVSEKRVEIFEKNIKENQELLKKREDSLRDAESRVSDCSTKLSECISSTSDCSAVLQKKDVELKQKQEMYEKNQVELEENLKEKREMLEKKQGMLQNALSRVSECDSSNTECAVEVKTCKDLMSEQEEQLQEMENMLKEKGSLVLSFTAKLSECASKLSAEITQEEIEELCEPHVEMMLQEYQEDASARLKAFRELEQSRDNLLKRLAERREEGLSSMRQQVLMMRDQRDKCVKQVSALSDLDKIAATCSTDLLYSQDEVSTMRLDLEECNKKFESEKITSREELKKCNEKFEERIRIELEKCSTKIEKIENDLSVSEKRCEEDRKRFEEMEQKCSASEEVEKNCQKRCDAIEEVKVDCAKNLEEKIQALSEEHEKRLQKSLQDAVADQDLKCQQSLNDLKNHHLEKENKCSDLENRLEECSTSSADFENRVEKLQLELQICNEERSDLRTTLTNCENLRVEDKKQCENNVLEMTRSSQEGMVELKSSMIKMCIESGGNEHVCEENPTLELFKVIKSIKDRNAHLESDLKACQKDNSSCSTKSVIFEKQFRERLENLNLTNQDLWYEYKLFYFAILFLVLMQPIMAVVFAKRMSVDVVEYIRETAKEMDDYFKTYANKNF
jgi:hypothetical protein